MTIRMVRYRLKPDRVAENEAYVTHVYEALRRGAPPGLNYATFKLADGVSFIHMARFDGDNNTVLPGLPAFREFVAGIADRCEEPPVTQDIAEVGSYRFFID